MSKSMDRLKLPIAVAVVLVATFALPVLSGEGRIPIWQPTVIDQPGHYVVSGLRVTAAASSSAIAINADGGSINGSITGNKIASVRAGILVRGGDGAIVENNVISTLGGDAISLSNSSSGCIVRGNRMRGADAGLYVDTDRNLIENNLATGCNVGFLLNTPSEGNVLQGNVARGNTTDFTDRGTGNSSAGDNFLPTLQ